MRAPVEFAHGHLPGAVNLPILNDSEREQVGTTYKRQGPEAAVALGHRLVAGEVKADRIRRWTEYAKTHPGTVVYCFRGGLRSQIARAWMQEAGVDVPLIAGGYKAARQYLISQTEAMAKPEAFTVVAGPTGSGKTRLLAEIRGRRALVDLEGLACHRGSAFGGIGVVQPTQTQFENGLAVELLRERHRFPAETVVIENESRLIGRNALPASLYKALRAAPSVWLDESVEIRVENIFQDYILNGEADKKALLARYRTALKGIARKLGGLRTAELLKQMDEAEAEFDRSGDLALNRRWIESLLVEYYDPFYLHGLKERTGKTLFRGDAQACRDFLLDHRP